MDPPRGATPEEVKIVGRVVDKLKYCKEVLGSIRDAVAGGGAAGEGGLPAEVGEPEREREREREEGKGKERGERRRVGQSAR